MPIIGAKKSVTPPEIPIIAVKSVKKVFVISIIIKNNKTISITDKTRGFTTKELNGEKRKLTFSDRKSVV